MDGSGVIPTPNSPRIYQQRDQVLVLEMNLAHNIVQQDFAPSIGAHRERQRIHPPDATERGAQRDKFGLWGFV